MEDATQDPAPVLGVVSETIGVATNNVAEYRAVIEGVRLASSFGSDAIEVRADSELVIKQLSGEYRIKDLNLQKLARQARDLLAHFATVELIHVRREFNQDADALVNAALDAAR